MKLEGVTDTEKSGGGATVRVTGAAPCEREPLVPVTVTEELPTGVVLSVVMVSVEPLPAVTEGGENEAVAPEGSPEALSVMEPVKPLIGLVEML